jgi:hypothetical protein
MRLASRNRETGRVTERFFLLKEPHCRGFESSRTQTVGEWIAGQGLAVYNEMNDRILELISLKKRCQPGPLALAARHRFAMALYDLDGFRKQIFEPVLAGDDRFDPGLRQAAKSDDVELLTLAVEWVKREIFQGQG